MNNNFIPNATPDGNEKGEHPAVDYQPAMPTECIKLPESPSAPVPSKRWPGWLINEATEITDKMWASLRHPDITPSDWFGRGPGTAPLGVKDRIVEKITNEKRGKIFPLSWDRVQFLAEQSYREWRAEAVRSRESAPGNPQRLSEDAVRDLVHGCEGSLRMRGAIHKIGWELASKIAQAAYKRGVEEMQKVMEAKNSPAAIPREGFWFRQQLQQIWYAPMGSLITADMKRAARVAIQIVDGCKWDGTAWQAPKAEKPTPSDQELHSQALGEQAALMGVDVLVAAFAADVPLPVPPGSATWSKIRPEID